LRWVLPLEEFRRRSRVWFELGSNALKLFCCKVI
jgi:hypothetical protein